MKKNFLYIVLMLIGLGAFSSAHGKSIKYPGKEIKKPINLCKESPDPELSTEAVTTLQNTIQAVECGNYKKALNMAYQAIELIEYLDQQTTTQLGYCYYKLNCRGNVASQVKVTKKHCKNLLGGKSWRKPNPGGGCISPI